MEKHLTPERILDFTWAKVVSEKALVQLSEFRAEVELRIDEIAAKAESLFWGGFWHGFVTAAILILIYKNFGRSRE